VFKKKRKSSKAKGSCLRRTGVTNKGLSTMVVRNLDLSNQRFQNDFKRMKKRKKRKFFVKIRRASC